MNDDALNLEILESRLEMEALSALGGQQLDAILPYECWCNQ